MVRDELRHGQETGRRGITSVCSTHPYAVTAAPEQPRDGQVPQPRDVLRRYSAACQPSADPIEDR